MIVTLNVPHIPGETEAENQGNETEGVGAKQDEERAKQLAETAEAIVTSLEIRDWGLFGGE